MFFLLDPVLEFNPLDDFRQTEGVVEFAPFFLADIIRRKVMAKAVLRPRQPLVFLVRWRTVANVLSMGLLAQTMRAVIYARYSSDLQTDALIEGQARLCRKLAEQNGWQVWGAQAKGSAVV